MTDQEKNEMVENPAKITPLEKIETQRIGNMSFDIIKKRCQQGRYRGRPCNECQVSLGGAR